MTGTKSLKEGTEGSSPSFDGASLAKFEPEDPSNSKSNIKGRTIWPNTV